MAADFPPSSRVVFLMFDDASSMIRRPTSVDPVNATLSTSGEETSASPAAAPEPGRTLTTPSGIPASRHSRPISRVVRGV
jgi:hypothetical protein